MLTASKDKLQDICTLITDGSHYSPPTVANGKPIASVKDMLDYDIDLESCRKISDEEYDSLVKNNCKPQINDVLIAKDGSFLKKIFIVEEEPQYVVLSSIGIFRPNMDLVNPYYLMYYFHLDSFRRYVSKGFVSGTALKRIVLDAFKRIEINIPPLEVQNEIVNKIKPIDDKIKVNTELISKLEEYTQLLFYKWFVDFNFPDSNGQPYKENSGEFIEIEGNNFPINWGYENLSSLGEIVSGGTPSKSNSDYFCEVGIPWITPKDLSMTTNKFIIRGERDITEVGLKKSSAKLMPKGTVLMSSRAPIGYLAISKNEVTTNQGFKSIVPKEGVGSEFIYFTLKRLMPKIERMGSGSTFKEVSKEMMSKLKVIIPEKIVLQKFQKSVHPLSEKLKLLEEENEKLIVMRDLLIKKLIK